MTLGELITLARIRLRDTLTPYLWDDATLTEFANSAVVEACMRSRLLQTKLNIAVISGLTEYTIPYTTLLPKHGSFIDKSGPTVVAGSFKPGSWYSILTVGTTDFTLIGAPSNTVDVLFRATGLGTGTGTAILGYSTPVESVSEDELNYFQATTPTAVGTPIAFKRGESANHIQLYPIPNLNGHLVLDIYRNPTENESMVSAGDEPVIPVEFHRDLVYWMMSEAYQIDDSDKKSADKVIINEKKFEERFGRKISARGEQMGRKGVIGKDMYPAPFGGSPTYTNPRNTLGGFFTTP